ncbi:hypothetical protein ACROYT_G015169 [Oculina patagonica]
MSPRLREKVYKYTMFYFPKSHQQGTAQTSIVAKGYRCHVKVGKVVMVLCKGETELVPVKIMQMDDEINVLWRAEKALEKELDSLKQQRHNMMPEDIGAEAAEQSHDGNTRPKEKLISCR